MIKGPLDYQLFIATYTRRTFYMQVVLAILLLGILGALVRIAL